MIHPFRGQSHQNSCTTYLGSTVRVADGMQVTPSEKFKTAIHYLEKTTFLQNQ